MNNHIYDALHNAAGSDNASIVGGHGRQRTAISTEYRINKLRKVILRFANDLPDHLTIRELREELSDH